MSHFSPDIIPSLSIDCVIFGYEAEKLKILLIERNINPDKGLWALPGGFILESENLRDAAIRILQEMTGLEKIYLEQLHTFGRIDRYPTKRVITIAYYALIHAKQDTLQAGKEATNVEWFSVKTIPNLAFDHRRIVDMAYERLKRKMRIEPVGFELLPEKFTLSQIHRLYETILDIKLDKPNFRRKFEKMNLLIPLDETQKGVAHRAARLYSFDPKVYEYLKNKGFVFEI